ncbi:cation diffusion facilitator family transporter [bacterium]|nr:cation diffusion facilitator family transporter [bacterium]
MSGEVNLQKGQALAQKAVFLETGLALAKLIVGFFSHSTVLLSDAFHSLSDLVNVLTSWLGLKIAGRRPDEKFPFGYYKAENLGTLLVSFLIIYTSWEMFLHGWQRLFSFSQLEIPLLALGVSLADAIILFFFGQYEVKIGKEVNARSLIAMGEENRTHLFSSLAVFLGILASWKKIPYLEGGVTLLIAFLILKIGLENLKEAAFALMDVSPGEEMEKKVRKIATEFPGIEEVLSLRLRKTGPFVLGELVVGVRRQIPTAQVHQITNQLQKKIKEAVPQITSLAVSVEPFVSDYRHLVIPVKKKDGLDVPVAERFGKAPFLLFVNLKKDKVKGFYFLKNPYLSQKVRVGLALAKLVVKQKSDILLTPEIGEIAFHVLRSNLVDVYRLKGKTAKEVVGNFLAGKLRLVERGKEIKS